ncbi:MAG: Chromosome partition protein Smc [Chlamydiae bacterium]|nr:Chromosome partition protein Smc [Chlamydiota bacterium]
MRLKKIKFLGFKSFADKTSLLFHPGITAIVGPNGCGKSNISDGFRWVLGEQSPKSMRGNRMPDVIFAGTSKRKPLNFAEVSLTLTDIDGKLPTEYEEVTVTRRLHRSGESDYLLNNRPVRLKDVHNLFLDSGMGKNAFSIFEQGKIEQVINLSPLERRYIFEEAAGILRFLQRKREALRRLEQTEQNIERVRDIHQEVEKQIIVLEEQAEKAKIYKENKELLEVLEIGLFVAKWENFQKKGDSTRLKAEEKKGQIEELNRAIERRGIDRQNGNIGLIEAQKELQTKREAVFQTRSDKEIKTKDWLASDERLKEMMLKEQQWRKELDEMIEKRKMRRVESERTLAQQREVEEEVTGLDGLRRVQQEKVHAIELEVGSIRDQQHEAQHDLLKLLQVEKQVESELKQTTLRIEHNNDRKVRIREHQEVLTKHVEELTNAIEGKKQEIEEVAKQIDAYKEQFSSLEEQIEVQTQKIQETQERLDSIYQERAEFKARKNVLVRLKDEMEGFSAGTKQLLQESEDPRSPLYNKIKGLYESLSPEQGAEMALSVVMKPYTQTLVVQTKDDYHAVLNFAREQNIKDFSLICTGSLAEEGNPSSRITDQETLFSHISENLLAKHFLKNVYLAKSVDEGTTLTERHPGVEIWTDDSAYIDRHQVLFYPSEGENNVFLREAELKILEKKIAESEVKRSNLEEELKGCVQQRGQIQSQKNELDQTLRQSEMKLIEQKYVLQRMETDLDKTKMEIGKEQTEETSLDQACAELKNAMAESNNKHASAKARADEVQKLVDTLNRQLEEQVAALKVEQLTMQEKESVYLKMVEEKRKIAHQLNVFEVKDLESLQQENRLEEEIKSINEHQSQLKLNRVEYEQQLTVIEKQLEQVQEDCKELEDVVSQRRNEIDQIDEDIINKRNELKQKEGEQYELGIQGAQIDSSRHALEQELQERFHLPVEEARAKNIVLEQTMEKTERKIRSLRRDVESAGDINMTSIEEFDKHKERYEFLNQQIDDLTISKEELVAIITQLDTESRKIFKETFEQIQQNFKKNFQILFSGGEADLQFTETADILEAGIEIVAKPPGKKMQSISLLSGGEKCLTAVALLFAIFEVKPAPFCILDEIDAPLDDTNVERFLNVVKQFTDKCQFIIITHNKRTMAIADVLYGVSMQEKGVSKLLSLEFSKDATPEPALV